MQAELGILTHLLYIPIMEQKWKPTMFKTNLKSFLIGFLAALIISVVAVSFIYKYLETDFDYRIASSKKVELRIPQDFMQAYEEGFLECLRTLNSNVYTAYLRCIIDYGSTTITDEQFAALAKEFGLTACQLDFLKVILLSAENTEAAVSNSLLNWTVQISCTAQI